MIPFLYIYIYIYIKKIILFFFSSRYHKKKEMESKRERIDEKKIQFQNKVITASLVDKYGCPVELDLRAIAACEYKDGVRPKYDPKKFNPIIYKYRDPSGPVLVFGKGVLLCAGTSSIVFAKYLIYKTVQSIRNHYFKFNAIFIDPMSFKEENLIASVQLPYKIQVDYKGKKRRFNRFTGVTQKVPEFPGVSILAFESGKLVATGAKSEIDALNAIRKAEPELYKKRKIGWDI